MQENATPSDPGAQSAFGDCPLLALAIASVAGAPCLKISKEILGFCRPAAFVDDICPPCEGAQATWLCENHVFFTLIRDLNSTLVYCHSNDMLYYASPAAQLSPACPIGTAFLCQFTVDSTGGSTPEGRPPESRDSGASLKTTVQTSEPRLLVFDLLSCEPGTSPHARGERLRALSIHLQHPLCCSQWVGGARYLTKDFIARLPHAVHGTFRLGAEPLKLTRC